MLHYERNAQGGFPPPLWLPDAITPEQVLRHHRSAQGRYGGTGTVPSFIVPARCFQIMAKGIQQSQKIKTFLVIKLCLIFDGV